MSVKSEVAKDRLEGRRPGYAPHLNQSERESVRGTGELCGPSVRSADEIGVTVVPLYCPCGLRVGYGEWGSGAKRFCCKEHEAFFTRYPVNDVNGKRGKK